MELNIVKKDRYFYFSGVNILTLPFTFFSINSLFSIEYEGAESSNNYAIVVAFSALFFYGTYLFRFFNRKILKHELFFFMIVFIIFFNAIFAYLFKGIETMKFFYQFILLVLPAFLFGLELSRTGSLFSISKLLFFIATTISLSVLFLIPKMLFIPTNELMTFFGGGHYQAFSYSVSFSFLVSLVYYFFYLENKTLLVNIFFLFLFIVQISGVALSGGRGGAGVVIIGLLFVLLNKFSLFKVFKVSLLIFTILVMITGCLYFYFGEYSDRILESIGRIFSFINDGGLDFTQTSNRELVYGETINLILLKPIFGFGLFGYLNETDGGYPHNFFLEGLLQGGILFLMIWSISFFFFFKKIIKLVCSFDHKYLLATFVYSFVLLMFSGTYLLEPFFWFNLSYVFMASLKSGKKMLNFDY